MSRHLGIGTWLAESLQVAEPLFAVLTQLGSTWLLGGLAVLLYITGDRLPGWDRRRGAVVLATALLAIALIGFLKTALALPRPEGAGTPAYAVPGLLGEVYGWASTADGYGVPSGHALGATAVYGTTAALVDATHRRRAVILSAVAIAIASFSRLALGVHLLVDIVAGLAAGIAVVWATTQLAGRPVVSFGLAITTAAGWVVLGGGDTEAIGATAVSLGALLAWHRYADRLVAVHREPTVGLIGGALLLSGLSLVAIEVGTTLVAAGAGLVGMATVVSLPISIE